MSLQVEDLKSGHGSFTVYREPLKIRQPDSKPGKTFANTRFIAALLLFFIVDLFIKIEIPPDRFAIPERSFIYWAVKDYRQLQHAPQILLFGSSLMLAAVNGADATHYRKLVDTATHHYCSYLDELLNNKHGYPISNFCFAIGGQMASDVYAIASNFVSDKFKPQVIVWGIAPRDLIDAAFPGAITSDTAQYMNKIAGKEIITDEHRTLNSLLDKFLGRLLFMYRERSTFFARLKDIGRNLQNKESAWLLGSNGSQINQPAGRQKMLRELINPRDGTMGDIEVGEWLIGANAEPSKTLKDNTGEYLVRYNPFKPKTFECQTKYLEKFLQKQKELGIKVLLVNMPLTGVNMSLLPEPVYNLYLDTVRQLAIKYDAQILDLNGDARFVQSDFFDTAHLNGLGSEKFIEVLSVDKRLALPNQNALAVNAQHL